ncbi:MAG TPA: hypothetical protein ENF80_03150 [Thermofilum sp.]|nr:hypothetical protein [Thermofilum sp.]
MFYRLYNRGTFIILNIIASSDLMRRKFRVIIDGEVYEVETEIGEDEDFLSLLRSLMGSEVRRVEPSSQVYLKPMRIRYGKQVVSPIAGKVIDVKVRQGQDVDEETTVVVLEAMKTQVEVKAGKRGKVKEIKVKVGDRVSKDQPLIEME